jgi:hypothetical protein
MKTAFLFVLAGGSLCTADELVLKDGKKIEWVTLKDQGDAYEVETPAGKRVTVHKTEIERLNVVPLVALTGASFSLDKKKSAVVDVLKNLNVNKAAIQGQWKIEKGALAGSPGADGGRAMLQTEEVLPEEYDIALQLERAEGANNFWLGLIGPGEKSFVLQLDAYGATVSGPQVVDGQDLKTSSVATKEKLLTNGKARSIVVMVRKAALIVQADGKDFLTWRADWSRVTPHPELEPRDRRSLWMGLSASSYRIYRLTVTTTKN